MEDALIPLRPEDEKAIARQEVAIILAAHLLNHGYPLNANNGTGNLITNHNGHRITITVKVQ